MATSGSGKSISKTFRLADDMNSQLDEESRMKGVTVNTLVNQILKSHMEYHTFSSKAGMISMPKALMVRIMDRLTEQEVKELSCYIAQNDLQDTILLMFGEYNASSIIGFIEAWAKIGGFAVRHHVKGIESGITKHSLVLQHDMGERWSLFFAELFKSALITAADNVKFQSTNNSLIFEYDDR